MAAGCRGTLPVRAPATWTARGLASATGRGVRSAAGRPAIRSVMTAGSLLLSRGICLARFDTGPASPEVPKLGGGLPVSMAGDAGISRLSLRRVRRHDRHHHPHAAFRGRHDGELVLAGKA